MKSGIFFVFMMTFLWTVSMDAATYQIDKDHTAVSFKIRHLFSKVQGSFTDFEGSLDYDEANPMALTAKAVIQARSVNTQVEQRDNHLRSADFFDVEKFPTLSFESVKVKEKTETGVVLEGVLTIHGQKRRVPLTVDIHGVGKDPWGNIRVGMTAATTINRKDFDLTWNKAVETGGALVGDEVEITIELEGIQQ